ncbi:MAG TPA: hypothetical protein VGO85_03500 [Caldimonas sp.]|nr:hypothetical protein [Caldimonas sp.]
MRFPNACLAAAILTMCAGCGGGGASSNLQPPAAATPLAIDTSNATRVAGLAPGLGEAILAIGQFAADEVATFRRPGAGLSVVSTCPNGGVMTVTLIDRDGDGLAGPGDQVTALARDCAVPVLADVVNGTMTVDLIVAADIPAGGLRATVALGSGLSFGATPATSAGLVALGSLQIDRLSDDLQIDLRVRSTAADDLRLIVPAGATSTATESVKQFDLRKILDYATARSTVTLAYRYESDLLGGSITVSTPMPLLANLNTFPEVGRIDAAGVNGSRVVLRPNFVTASSMFTSALDANGDAIAERTDSLSWTDSTSGYLWWDGTTALSWSGGDQVISPRSFSTIDFFASLNFDWKTSTTTPFRLQFSRPLADTTPALFARLIDAGNPSGLDPTFVDIATTVERHGALLLVRPTLPLRHGHNYFLQLSADNINFNSAVTVQDAIGNASSNFSWPSMFKTPDTLHAIASADAPLLLTAADAIQLSGQASVGTPKPIASYRWTQLSGVPLTFATPNAANTRLTWGVPVPTVVADAVVRLTVTDASGDTDSVQLTVRAGNSAGSAHVLYFRSAAGDYIGQGRTEVYVDQDLSYSDMLSTPSYYSGYHQGLPVWWTLQLATGDGSPLHVGAYEDAIRAPFRGNQNGIDFSGSGRGCNQTVGRFDVLEIATNGAGALTKLAVDFEQHCESPTAPALLGSYRFNSSIALRR